MNENNYFKLPVLTSFMLITFVGLIFVLSNLLGVGAECEKGCNLEAYQFGKTFSELIWASFHAAPFAIALVTYGIAQKMSHRKLLLLQIISISFIGLVYLLLNYTEKGSFTGSLSPLRYLGILAIALAPSLVAKDDKVFWRYNHQWILATLSSLLLFLLFDLTFKQVSEAFLLLLVPIGLLYMCQFFLLSIPEDFSKLKKPKYAPKIEQLCTFVFIPATLAFTLLSLEFLPPEIVGIFALLTFYLAKPFKKSEIAQTFIKFFPLVILPIFYSSYLIIKKNYQNNGFENLDYYLFEQNIFLVPLVLYLAISKKKDLRITTTIVAFFYLLKFLSFNFQWDLTKIFA